LPPGQAGGDAPPAPRHRPDRRRRLGRRRALEQVTGNVRKNSSSREDRVVPAEPMSHFGRPRSNRRSLSAHFPNEGCPMNGLLESILISAVVLLVELAIRAVIRQDRPALLAV